MKKLESSLVNMVVVLTVISVIAGGLLAYINKVTQEPIAAINEKNLQDGIKKVILGSETGELNVEQPVETDGFVIYQTDKGTAVKAVENGFGGPLEILVGFDEAGNILGYTVLSTVETPGLGVKADTWFQKGQKVILLVRTQVRRSFQCPRMVVKSTPLQLLPLPVAHSLTQLTMPIKPIKASLLMPIAELLLRTGMQKKVKQIINNKQKGV